MTVVAAEGKECVLSVSDEKYGCLGPDESTTSQTSTDNKNTCSPNSICINVE